MFVSPIPGSGSEKLVQHERKITGTTRAISQNNHQISPPITQTMDAWRWSEYTWLKRLVNNKMWTIVRIFSNLLSLSLSLLLPLLTILKLLETYLPAFIFASLYLLPPPLSLSISHRFLFFSVSNGWYKQCQWAAQILFPYKFSTSCVSLSYFLITVTILQWKILRKPLRLFWFYNLILLITQKFDLFSVWRSEDRNSINNLQSDGITKTLHFQIFNCLPYIYINLEVYVVYFTQFFFSLLPSWLQLYQKAHP